MQDRTFLLHIGHFEVGENRSLKIEKLCKIANAIAQLNDSDLLLVQNASSKYLRKYCQVDIVGNENSFDETLFKNFSRLPTPLIPP